jgi:EAL domain-containing protein (putative c-di-GMP-specific phosphodiesterase class I)
VNFSQTIFVGAAHFNHGATMSTLLADADINLADAEKNGGMSARAVTKTNDAATPQNMTEWSEILWDSIQQNRIRLENFAVVDAHGLLMHEECSLRLQFKADEAWQPAGKFISIAERLQMTPALDLAAVKLGIEQLSVNKKLPALAINLSANSIKDHDFCNTVLALLKKHANVAPRLWLEINTEQAFLNFGKFKAFCLMMKETKVVLGLEHLGHHFGKIGTLYDLGLDYIKVDAIFINDIDQNTGNQIFLHGLTDIAHNIGIKVIAEGISNEAERKMAFSLGFDGVTGTGVKI